MAGVDFLEARGSRAHWRGHLLCHQRLSDMRQAAAGVPRKTNDFIKEFLYTEVLSYLSCPVVLSGHSRAPYNSRLDNNVSLGVRQYVIVCSQLFPAVPQFSAGRVHSSRLAVVPAIRLRDHIDERVSRNPEIR